MLSRLVLLAVLFTKVQLEINETYQKEFNLALEAVTGIGIRLYSFLQDDPNENFMVSPISAAVLATELMLGTDGKFREELADLLALPEDKIDQRLSLNHYNAKEKINVTYALPYTQLHFQLSELLKVLQSHSSTKSYLLYQNSAVFADQHIQLNQTFTKLMDLLYDAQVVSLDFQKKSLEAQKYINSWISKNTNGLIESYLSSPPRPNTASIFVNTIYFKADWQTPFSDTLNRISSFNITANKSVQTTFMIGVFEELLYGETPDYKFVSLPYVNEELAMFVILPRKHNTYKYDIKKFVKSVKSDELFEAIGKAKIQKVVLKMPKMTIKTSFQLLEQLQKYRLYKETEIKNNATLDEKVVSYQNLTYDQHRLHEGIYLTAAADTRNLRIDDIVQQVAITINEKGTEAAVITASTIDYIGGSKNFLIDRPFTFFIRHEATGVILFWGTVTNPTA